MAKKELPEFRHISLEYMMNYIEQNAPQDKAWFKSVAYDIREKKERIPKYYKDGTPVMKISKKTGKSYHATEMKIVPGSEKIQVFNLLKAKLAFCNRYMPEIIPVATEKGPKASDLLANW